MSEETIPPPPSPPVPQPSPRVAPAAIWSLVLAVLSFTCGWAPYRDPGCPMDLRIPVDVYRAARRTFLAALFLAAITASL